MQSCHRQALTGAVFALCCLVLAAGTPAVSQAADNIGIWFDPTYTQNDLQVSSFPHFGEAYLVLHDPSLDGVGGWECRVAASGPVTLLTWILEGQPANFTNPPEFVVGLGSPLPAGTDVLLATVQFMIDAAAPVTFSLGPVVHASIPGSMAYIPFADPNILVEMTTATGYPEVAWCNRDLPVCSVTPESVAFGLQPVGAEAVRTVTVANVGGGQLYLNPRLVGDCDTFRIVSGGAAGALGPGQQRIITIGFQPTGLVAFACELELDTGSFCGSVPLTGYGREPVISGYVGPNPLLFGGVIETTSFDRTVAVRNDGEIPLEVNAQPFGCTAFTIVGATVFTVPPGGQVPMTIRFTPPAPGDYACEVALHSVIPPLVINGTGLEAAITWTVSPISVDFGAVGEGSAPVQRTVSVRNTGDLSAALDLGLIDASGVFSIISPTNLTPVVNPNTNVSVVVAFSPLLAGEHTGTLVLGGGAPDVPLAGVAQPPTPSCDVTTGLLDFGSVAVLGQSSRSFRVNNTGNTVLTIAPTVSCSEFVAQSFPATIAPGGFGWITMAYHPIDLGIDLCVLNLGPDACSTVNLLGEGVSGGGTIGEDEVGISFSSDYYDPQGFTGIAPIRSYVVMTNTSVGDGVFAWELKITHEPMVIMLGTYLRGQAINFMSPPEFLVGLAAPLPEAGLIVLAEIDFLPLDLNPHWLSLGPVSIPSIPGQMAWAYNDNYDLAVMTPLGGEAIVAWINPGGPLAVLAPTPQVSLADGRVELRWPVPTDGSDGCHVYRSIGGTETRLTASPLQPEGRGFVYADDLAGLTGGGTAAYSYAIVRGGTEIARSPAAEIELPSPTVLATRLQPNRPNPFNPETEIHFTLAAAGSVRLSVYDVTGRRIAVLEDGVRSVGAHHVTWRGRDDAGRAVPSGSYYVRLETVTGRDTRKILLLK